MPFFKQCHLKRRKLQRNHRFHCRRDTITQNASLVPPFGIRRTSAAADCVFFCGAWGWLCGESRRVRECHHGLVECDIEGRCPPSHICVCGDPKVDKIGNPGCKDARPREASPGFLAYLCLDCRPYDMGCFGSAESKQDADEYKKQKEKNKKINQQIQKDKQEYRATHRLLLLGECPHDHSG